MRPVARGDVDGLVALYEGLSEVDLYRRFFQAHVPPRSSIEKMADAGARGDISLVAEVTGAAGTRTLVGEAACALLPDGDGELAITVAPEARGWTGPYLLALLCDEAAARGIPNIEADVLLDNTPMLALARARGYATMDHSECPSVVRVLFNTVGRVPSWPSSDRPRVVVEAPGARWFAEEEARASGLAVLVCPGPGARSCRCPAMAGWSCPLAGSADLVVDAVDPSTSEAGRRLLQAHRALLGHTRLYVDHGPGRRGARPELRMPGVSDGRASAVVGELHRLLARRVALSAKRAP